MTGTPLLIGQILTIILFLGVGAALVWWCFRPDRPPERRPDAQPPRDGA